MILHYRIASYLLCRPRSSFSMRSSVHAGMLRQSKDWNICFGHLVGSTSVQFLYASVIGSQIVSWNVIYLFDPFGLFPCGKNSSTCSIALITQQKIISLF